MTLDKLGAGIDFVQDATPPASDAVDGDLYLDTSLSPPQVKVFIASAGVFTRPQTGQNLDQKVSTAGATESEISSGVDASSTASTVSKNLDAPVSGATDKNTQSEIVSGVNAADTGVDWSSKTPRLLDVSVGSNSSTQVNGSGYITGVYFENRNLELFIDSSQITSTTSEFANQPHSLLHRFNNGFKVENNNNNVALRVIIFHVFD
jgi:hypothetical protein